jgi:hypothetical protein
MDDGYFPRGRSMLRRVHDERAVGLHYGQRALLIGAADPRNYAGTALNTSRPAVPFGRLAHTAELFETIYFGTRAQADRVLARVADLHERVVDEVDPAPRRRHRVEVEVAAQGDSRPHAQARRVEHQQPRAPREVTAGDRDQHERPAVAREAGARAVVAHTGHAEAAAEQGRLLHGCPGPAYRSTTVSPRAPTAT